MDLFSISQLSRFSGIKPHTIRIWEQRYNALQPNRSDGNTRYYDSGQLRRLLNIVSLMGAEYKVSELCGMPDNKLFSIINESIEKGIDSSGRSEYYISQLIASGMSYDEVHFDKIFSNCLMKYGMKEVYVQVIYPMLVRVGLMWSGDKVPPGNEHFISNLVRQKLFSAIDALPPPKATPNKWILFLQEDEFHEIGLLLANYIIRSYGHQVVYLGANVPIGSLTDTLNSTNPRYLLFFVVHHETPESLAGIIQQLSGQFKGEKIFVSGISSVIGQLNLPQNVEWLKNVDDLERLLAK